MATKQGIHRSTAGSKAGRKVAAQSGPLNTGLVTLTAEQKAWNDAIEAKRAAGKVRK